MKRSIILPIIGLLLTLVGCSTESPGENTREEPATPPASAVNPNTSEGASQTTNVSNPEPDQLAISSKPKEEISTPSKSLKSEAENLREQKKQLYGTIVEIEGKELQRFREMLAVVPQISAAHKRLNIANRKVHKAWLKQKKVPDDPATKAEEDAAQGEFDEARVDYNRIPNVRGTSIDFFLKTKVGELTLYIEDEKKIDQLIKKEISYYEKDRAGVWGLQSDPFLSICFGADGDGLVGSKTCTDRIGVTCSEFGLNQGRVEIMAANSNFDEAISAVDSEEDYLQYLSFLNLKELPENRRRMLAVCKLAALNGLQQPIPYCTFPTAESKKPPHWTSKLPIAYTLDEQKKNRKLVNSTQIQFSTFKEECLDDGNLFEVRAKLSDLLERLKKREGLKVANFSGYLHTLDDNIEACKIGATEACIGFNRIGDLPALRYETVECKIRNVTKADVDKDSGLMSEAGRTQADVNLHLLLKETIDGCNEALNQGFTWVERLQPEPSQACIRNKKTKQ